MTLPGYVCDNDTVQNCNESLTDSDPDELRVLGQTDSDRGSTDDSDSQAQDPSGPADPTLASGSQANTFTGRSLDRIEFMSLERSCRLCSNSLGCRSPKGFRRPFNVVTRSFLKYRLRVPRATLPLLL